MYKRKIRICWYNSVIADGPKVVSVSFLKPKLFHGCGWNKFKFWLHFSVGASKLFVSFIFSCKGDKRLTNSFQLQIALLTLLASIKRELLGQRRGKKDWLLELVAILSSTLPQVTLNPDTLHTYANIYGWMCARCVCVISEETLASIFIIPHKDTRVWHHYFNIKPLIFIVCWCFVCALVLNYCVHNRKIGSTNKYNS